MEFQYYDWEEFKKFLNSLPNKDATELTELIFKIQKVGFSFSAKQQWIKKLSQNLYEIRSRRANNIQRVVYFHVENHIFVISHGFTKKTNKIPLHEINKAKRRKVIYLTRKDLHND